MHRVVILGGYGNFGTVIARRLSHYSRIKVIVAGRDLSRAKSLAAKIDGEAAKLDASAPDFQSKLKDIGAETVISTAGPFQRQDYAVPRAAIACSAHYIDIADSRAFVCGIGELDAFAKASGVLVTSGASSVPALSAAVIDHYLSEFKNLTNINYGISSSERTPGIATVSAVLGYCGKPFERLEDGRWVRVFGWDDHSVHALPILGTRWFANCDVPDLQLFPTRYPSVRTVRFQAGTGLRATQYGTELVARLVRRGIVSDAARYSVALRLAAVALEFFGDGMSGMFVELSGTGTNNNPHHRVWELIARRNHGPAIPCMAAVVIAKKIADGHLTERGATPCVGLVDLNDYMSELQDLDISVFAY